MSSLNKVLILGRLGADPEVRYTSDQQPVATLNVATSSYTNKNGEKKEYTEWHRCVAFNKAAEFAQMYLGKGSQILIEGSLRTRKWQDKQGIDRYTTEIVVGRLTSVGDKKKGPEEHHAPAGETSAATSNDFSSLDDDFPF